jgi:hypothetical protein
VRDQVSHPYNTTGKTTFLYTELHNEQPHKLYSAPNTILLPSSSAQLSMRMDPWTSKEEGTTFLRIFEICLPKATTSHPRSPESPKPRSCVPTCHNKLFKEERFIYLWSESVKTS